MKRLMVLGVLVAGGAASLTVAAFQQPAGQPAPIVVEADKIKDNLYVLKGGGGNSSVFITAAGVVVVDTKNPGWGAPLLAKLKTITDKPVTTIINTHTHGDHVSGNVEFPATVDNPMSSLNPVFSIGMQMREAVALYHGLRGRGLAARAARSDEHARQRHALRHRPAAAIGRRGFPPDCNREAHRARPVSAVRRG